VPEQELNLIQFAASEVTEPRTWAPEIVWGELVDAGARSRCPYYIPNHLC